MGKLCRSGISATRAKPSDMEQYANVLSGDCRFGTELICRHMYYMYVHTVYTSVFMSPETAINNQWRTLFGSNKVALVSIDEAHCIPEWLVLFGTM